MTTARLALLALLLTGSARADDGAMAPPGRWNHARGPASCSGQSLARPPTSFGRIAWTHKAKAGVLAPPVVWDGAAFILEGDAAKADLVALDIESGDVWARTKVQAPGSTPPAAYERSVFLVEEGRRLVQYRLEGRSWKRGWTYDAGEPLSAPRIIDGEVYVTTPSGLLSLRPGLGKPAWKVAGSFTGDPAVRDREAYALRREGANLVLAAYLRADGKEAASVSLGDNVPSSASGGRVVVGEYVAAALVPPDADGKWAILSRKMADGKLELAFSRTESLRSEPMAGQRVLVALADKPDAVTLLFGEGKHLRQPIVTAKDRPELFESITACTWLGESGHCYGSWCGDIYGNIIYWHASERPEGAPLRKGLRFHAVPARHELLLFVPADGKSILALAPEAIR